MFQPEQAFGVVRRQKRLHVHRLGIGVVISMGIHTDETSPRHITGLTVDDLLQSVLPAKTLEERPVEHRIKAAVVTPFP